MSLTLIVLTGVAITVVWSEGKLFDWVQNHGPKLWQDLAGCPLCSGFWIGLFWSGFWLRSGIRTLEGGALVFGLGALVGAFALACKLGFDVLDALDTREKRE